VENKVTLRQAAEVLGLTPDAVRKRIVRGALEGEKIDGQWYLPDWALDKAVAESEKELREEDTLVEVLRERIADKERENERLYRQLEELNRRMSELTERIPQLPAPEEEVAAVAEVVNRLAALEERIEKRDRELMGLVRRLQEERQDRRPWWRRVLGK